MSYFFTIFLKSVVEVVRSCKCHRSANCGCGEQGHASCEKLWFGVGKGMLSVKSCGLV